MKAGTTLLLVLFLYTSFAQNAYNTVTPTRAILPPPTYLRDVFTTPIQSKPHAGIQGTCFLEDKWTLARLKVEGRKEVIDSFHIKINVYDTKIHFMEKGVEMETTLKVEEIKIIDTESAFYNKTFLSNFDQESGFFEVLAEGGKWKVLKRHRVYLWESKPLGMEPQKRFEAGEELYFSSNRVLYKANKSCTFLKDTFGNNKKIFDYISENNIRCNKEEDMRKLIAFVASLQ
ncbi:MAG TPA: hypothetical protein VFU29_18540 [Chitinophagaceae bacterium]|nr:hypothetical protein [Chitinophagaceae bacterium]